MKLSSSAIDHGAKTITHMSQDNLITSNGSGVASANQMPMLDTSDLSPAPPPAPPQPSSTRPKPTADFAASAAMAKDILALGTDGDERVDVPAAVDAVRPRPVPELDAVSMSEGTAAGSPMAPDFFTPRARSRKRMWRFAR